MFLRDPVVTPNRSGVVMTRNQRYKYETFVRVRDYGTAHQDLFPESSTGGQKFAEIAAIVARVDALLESRALARAGAQRVKTTTRARVFNAMKIVAQAARRAARSEPGVHPFRIPRRRTLKADISTARLFIAEAAKRQEQFARFGLPPTFIGDLTTLVDALEQAVNVRLNSKTGRRLTQTGIQTELQRGSELIRDLDVEVAVATQDDPARLAAWRSARVMEGQGSAPTAAPTPEATTASAPETNAQSPVLVLEKAS
jgi:hypothetical protein